MRRLAIWAAIIVPIWIVMILCTHWEAPQRDGWGHLYRYDMRTGKLLNRITGGNWLVRDIIDIDEPRGIIYFGNAQTDRQTANANGTVSNSSTLSNTPLIRFSIPLLSGFDSPFVFIRVYLCSSVG